MRATSSLAAAVVCVALLFASGCSTADTADDGAPAASPQAQPSQTPVAAEAPHETAAGGATELEVLPSATLTDWVTYVDRVVSATVIDITRMEATQEEYEAGEGLEGRVVTLRLDDTLWESERAHDLDETFTVPSGAWLFGEDREERRLTFPGVVQLERDHSYLLPMFYDESFDPAWQGISSSAVFPFDDGVVGQGETILDHDRKPIAPEQLTEAGRTLWGLDRDAVAELLAAAEPHPAAAEYADLPPVERYGAVGDPGE